MHYLQTKQAHINQLIDESLRQNVIFFSCQIKDDEAAYQRTLEFLQMGAKANYVDSLGQTPLFYVCRDGRIKLAQLLVQHGCDVNHLDTYG